MSKPITFHYLGADLGADEVVKLAPKRAKREVSSEPYHKGFRVIGLPPGSMETAKTRREADLALWAKRSGRERAEAFKRGEKEPKAWDADAWMRAAKRTAVRSKPYEAPGAADQCKAMAERAGWICVDVVEVKRGGE